MKRRPRISTLFPHPPLSPPPAQRSETRRAGRSRAASTPSVAPLRRPARPAGDVFEMSRTPLLDPIETAQRRDDLKRLVEDVGRLPEQQRINDSAENVEDYLQGSKADYIVSSVPFTSLPANVRRSLLDAARRALAPDGQMLILQYSTAVLPYLQSIFPTIRRRFSPLNIPPAFLFA